MLIGLTLAAWLAIGTARLPARAQSPERILGYDVAIQIQRDESIVVKETIDYDFGTVQRHGIFRDVPTTLDTTTPRTGSTRWTCCRSRDRRARRSGTRRRMLERARRGSGSAIQIEPSPAGTRTSSP